MTWRRTFGLALIAALLVVSAAARAERWKPLPWGLVNYYYLMPDIADFRTLAVDVELQGRLDVGQYVYISPLNGKIGGNGFYFGLQTDLYHGNSRSLRAKGIIFSRWGAAVTSDAKPAADGWAESMTNTQSGEGDFTSVRVLYDWKPGAYTFRLETRSAAPQPGLWADLVLIDHAKGRRIEVGSLRFPTSSPAKFDPAPASFVEIYGNLPRVKGNPDLLIAPDFTVKFGPPRVNGAILPIGNNTYQSRRIPPLAHLTPSADHGATVVVGGTAAAQ